MIVLMIRGQYEMSSILLADSPFAKAPSIKQKCRDNRQQTESRLSDESTREDAETPVDSRDASIVWALFGCFTC
jgi:hypothetical protein